MNKSTLLAACVGAMMMIGAPLAIAKDDMANMLPMSKALSGLKTKGFEIVKKIELEDGMYEAKIINPLGKEMKVKMNAKTGEIEKPKEGLVWLSAFDVAKKVEDAGYTHISKIDTEGKEYEVKALNKEGKETKLKVNAQTGEIAIN